jgi:hypothetical protein
LEYNIILGNFIYQHQSTSHLKTKTLYKIEIYQN